MPPVSSQGNRAALVTWSVITGILFVVATIFAIYFYVDSTKTAQKNETLSRTYHDVLTEADLSSPAISDLKALRGTENNGLPGVTASTPVFQVLLTQRDHYATLLGGPTAGAQAATAARGALERAGAVAKDSGINVPNSDNLAQAVIALSDGLRVANQKNKDLQGSLAEAKQQQANMVKQFDAARATMNKTIDAIRGEQQKTLESFTTYQGQSHASIADIEKARDQERAAAQDAANKAAVAIAELRRTVDKQNSDLETLRNRLAAGRLDVNGPITRNPDGHILRIPARDTVYIDLGSANSITPGLTFEVYDKQEGIPKAGDPSNDENLPKGKASIEVTRVGSNSSECHVVRQTPGTQITEGDIIANLVYDPNTKYNFMVYGDFDLDRNNLATPQEAEVVRRLITQWGGKLTDQVNVDTDFVVLGKEPVLPSFSREDLQDPFNAKKLADAQTALDQYLAMKKQAADLHIPILNQNRFLYLIGYYAQAKR
ncbi:MAG TPA: hypothetical protein VF669_12250 [Tepidisphaeraceae bacterium]|jgi:hypothetical protein